MHFERGSTDKSIKIWDMQKMDAFIIGFPTVIRLIFCSHYLLVRYTYTMAITSDNQNFISGSVDNH